MPLYIKENEPNEVTSVLLPFGKDQLDTSVLRKYSGLNYDPEIPLGPKDISCFFHPENKLKIFNTFCDENPGLLDESLKKEIYDACRTIVHHEDAFIDLAFEMGNIEGLTAQQVKEYIRWIANRRLSQLRLNEIYEVKENPLTWLDDMLNGVEHMNFFEGRATEYSKASTKGSWVEAFEFTK